MPKNNHIQTRLELEDKVSEKGDILFCYIKLTLGDDYTRVYKGLKEDVERQIASERQFLLNNMPEGYSDQLKMRKRRIEYTVRLSTEGLEMNLMPGFSDSYESARQKAEQNLPPEIINALHEQVEATVTYFFGKKLMQLINGKHHSSAGKK